MHVPITTAYLLHSHLTLLSCLFFFLLIFLAEPTDSSDVFCFPPETPHNLPRVIPADCYRAGHLLLTHFPPHRPNLLAMHEPVTFRSSSSPATATGDLVWPNPATMFPLPTPGMYSPGSRPQGSGRESGRDQAGSGAALEILTPKMFTYGSCMIALDTTYLPRLLGVVPLEQEIASLAEIGQVALEIMFGCVEDDSAPDAQSGFHEEGGRGGWTLAGRSEALMVGVWGIPNVHRTPTPD